jgi:DNA-binding FadR family transcriptional regulator
LQSIKKVNYVNEAYSQIDEMIASGVWVEGQKIPSETALAKELGVSRVVIREALQRMRAERKIITRQGVGSFCANPNNYIDFIENTEDTVTDEEMRVFQEFRSTVEYPVYRLAAKNRTEEDIAALLADQEKMKEAEGDAVAYTKADAMFHYHIYCASHNPYFIKSYNAVMDLMVRVLFRLNSVPDAYNYSRKFHKQLFECIRDGRDVDLIEIMQTHDNYNVVRSAARKEKKNT